MKSKTILIVCVFMLLILSILGCNQNPGNKSAANDTTENRLSIGEHFASVNGFTLHSPDRTTGSIIFGM